MILKEYIYNQTKINRVRMIRSILNSILDYIREIEDDLINEDENDKIIKEDDIQKYIEVVKYNIDTLVRYL